MEKYSRDANHYKNLYDCLLRLDNDELRILGDRYSDTLLTMRKSALPTIHVASFWVNKFAYLPLSADIKVQIMNFILLCNKNFLWDITIYGLFLTNADIIYIQSLGVKYRDISESCPNRYARIFTPSNNLSTMIDYGKYIISGDMLNTYTEDYVFVTDLDLLDTPDSKPQCKNGQYPYKLYGYIEKVDKLGVCAIYKGSSFENNMYFYKSHPLIKNALYDFPIKYLGEKFLAYLPLSTRLDSIDILKIRYTVGGLFPIKAESAKIASAFNTGKIIKYASAIHQLVPPMKNDRLRELVIDLGLDIYGDCYIRMNEFIAYISIKYRNTNSKWTSRIESMKFIQTIPELISNIGRIYDPKLPIGYDLEFHNICLNYEVTHYNEDSITQFDLDFVKGL